MLTLPKIEARPERAYAYIRFTVPMNEVAKPANEGFPALFGFLAQNQIKPVGAAFYNYRRIDMAATMEIEAGVPVERIGTGDGRILFGTLPAGNYAMLTHTGHYNELMDVTAVMIGWLKEKGIALDVQSQPDGDHFACRLEIYETDPAEEPDPNKWVTILAFKTAD